MKVRHQVSQVVANRIWFDFREDMVYSVQGNLQKDFANHWDSIVAQVFAPIAQLKYLKLGGKIK